MTRQPPPYWDAEQLLPEPVTCELCRLEATAETIWTKPAWYREGARADGQTIVAVRRCIDVDSCRARVVAGGETWPLLDRGEDPCHPRRLNSSTIAAY